jgi:hypothetical protein
MDSRSKEYTVYGLAVATPYTVYLLSPYTFTLDILYDIQYSMSYKVNNGKR